MSRKDDMGNLSSLAANTLSHLLTEVRCPTFAQRSSIPYMCSPSGRFQPSNNAYPCSTFSLPVAHTVKEEEGCNQGGVGRGEGLPLLHAIGGMITGSLAATRRRKEEEEG